MRVAVLGSGSGGNALVVASRGRRLLIDAGFSCRQIEGRLASLGEEDFGFDGVLLTHEHHDHCRGVDVFARRHEVPVYATAGTLAAVREGLERRFARQRARGSAGRAGERAPAAFESRVIRSGEPFEVAGRGTEPGTAAFRVEAFHLPHDAREPVGFVVEDAAGCRLGLVADLGGRSQLAWGRLRDLDCLVLETNHDLQMLRSGPYPWHLKQRVASRHGHLSNHDAAEGLPELLSDRLEAVILYHLSQTNNLPELATETIAEKLCRCGSRAEVVVARQDAPTAWIEIPEGALRRVRSSGKGPGAGDTGPRQLELW